MPTNMFLTYSYIHLSVSRRLQRFDFIYIIGLNLSKDTNDNIIIFI